MGAKTGAKAGRPLKHNGKGKVQEKEESPVGPDYSLLRKPVEISVSGLSEVVKVFQNSPPELHHLLSYECDVVYECKVCRNLFRSLANFISHKRVYCTELHGNTYNHLKSRRVNDTAVIVEPEPVRTTRSRESWRTSDAVNVSDKEDKELRDQKSRNGQVEAAPFRITIKKDLTSIVEKLMQKNATQTLTETVGHLSSTSEFYDSLSKDLNERKKEAKQQTIHLEPMENTSFGVFQTVVQTSNSPTELIKSQVQDLHRIMSDTDAVLGPDGRVIENCAPQNNTVLHDDRRKKPRIVEGEQYDGPPVTAPESEVELFCNLCKEDFSSFKGLNHHMKSLHMTFRTFYPCPCCKLPLSNSWSVYRHLLKVHRKTNEQIRKLREKVIKRSFRKEVLQSGAQKLSKSNVSENPLCPSELIYDSSYNTTVSAEDSDKEWFGLIEDGLDMQCCRGCGRRFERRAALLAHSQSCLKQMAVKQNVSSAGRSSAQSDKNPVVGRASQSSKVAASSVALSTSAPFIPVARPTAALPIHPLNHSLHLTQENQTAPTKKIEIQIRRDYGKTQAPTIEYRTRTPSLSRSDDGAPSVSRSDDGTSSGGSETEGSGLTDKGSAPKDLQEINPMENLSAVGDKASRPSLPTQVQKVSSGMGKVDLPVKRGVGRPRKNRSVVVHVNGVKDEKFPPGMSLGESDDSSDLKDKSVKAFDSSLTRKRKSVVQLTAEDESEDENSLSASALSSKASFPSEQVSEDEHSNERKLQCLTCLKKFKSRDHLQRHVEMHLRWNRFRCIMCDFRCYSRVDCISHALSKHLDPWEKEKAVAMVQDIQMDAGGSTDVQPFDSQADSGDSDSGNSDPRTSEKSEDSSPDELRNESSISHDGHTLDDVGEMIGVAWSHSV